MPIDRRHFSLCQSAKKDHTRVTTRQCLEIGGALTLDVSSVLRMPPHPEGAPCLFLLNPEVVVRSDAPTSQPQSVNNRDAGRLGKRDQIGGRGSVRTCVVGTETGGAPSAFTPRAFTAQRLLDPGCEMRFPCRAFLSKLTIKEV